MQPRVKVSFILLMVLLCTAAVQAQTYTGIVKVDSIEAVAGTSFSVAVRLQNNNIPFSMITVPLRYNHPYLTLDSVSFVGTMLPNNWSEAVDHNASEKTVKISYVPEFVSPIPTISSTSGIIAKLFFKVSASANPTTIVVDSINKDSLLTGNLRLITRIQIADNTGLSSGLYEPDFVPGAIKVLVPTGVDDDPSGLPSVFTLEQNYPNPFNAQTAFSFNLPAASDVSLKVYDLLGREVATVVNGAMNAGAHTVNWSAEGLATGVYMYTLTAGEFSQSKKLLYLK